MPRKLRTAVLSIAQESETTFGVFRTETEIRDPRITFNVQKTKDKNPNTCSLAVYNLSEHSRSLFQHKPSRVSISAGYDDANQLIFTGNMTWSESSQKGVDVVTEVAVGDGARAMRFARVSRSFAPGTQVITAVLYAIKAMNYVAPANLVQDSALRAKFQSGETLHGSAKEALTRLLDPYGYEWSVQNGNLQVLRPLESLPSEAIISETILGDIAFGPPSETAKSKKKPVLTVPMILNPELQIGQKVRIQATKISGRFKILEVTHTGDTHGEAWSTTIQATEI